jgi:hypothetical protein
MENGVNPGANPGRSISVFRSEEHHSASEDVHSKRKSERIL